jgi:putative transposase
MSDRALTGSARAFVPFWNACTQRLSKRLWLPTKTGCAVSDLTSWTGSSKNTMSKSWFTANMAKDRNPSALYRMTLNCRKTYLPSAITSSQKTMENVRKEIDACASKASKAKIKAHQHVLRTTKKQRELFSNWFGVVRWTYNKCVEKINECKDRREKCNLTRNYYRGLFLNEESAIVQENPWLLDVPYDIRDGAVIDVLDNLTSNLTKVKNRSIKTFRLSFRAKKDKTHSIYIPKKHYKYKPKIKSHVICTRYWSKSGCESLTTCRKGISLPKKLERDSRLVSERANNRYVLAESVNYAVFDECRAKGGENQAAFDPVIALDPGVRTFQTGYDPRGYVFEFGKGDIGRIIRLCKHMDDLISRTTKVRCRKRYRINRRALPRMRDKIHNLVMDLHRKLAYWLCSNYKYVILPKYETSKMVVKGHRKITRRTVRSMMTWSNYRFKQILLHKAKETSTVIHSCTEEYTSKTCTRCGTIKYNLGGSKVFRCGSCDLVVDRDYNGCRNIFLKVVSETH